MTGGDVRRGRWIWVFLLWLAPGLLLICSLIVSALGDAELVRPFRWPVLTTSLLVQFWVLAGCCPGGRQVATRLILCGVFSASEVVLGFELLGWARQLANPRLPEWIGAFLVAQGLVTTRRFFASNATTRDAKDPEDGRIAAVVGSWLALWLVVAIWTRPLPPMHNDALTYHLTFAVEWLQRGDLATPFQAYGDPAPTFYPLASTLLYSWSLALEQGDFWARSTQAAGVVLLAAALVALTARLGGGRAAALFATLGLVSVRLVRNSPSDPGDDILLAACLLMAVALLAELRDGSWDVVAAFSVAVAMAVGMKYIGLLYAPAVVAAALASAMGTQSKRRLVVLVAALGAALAALASYPYLRNLVSTGSIVYPAAVRGVPGLDAAQGAAVAAIATNDGFSWRGMGAVLGRLWPAIVVAGGWGAVRILGRRRSAAPARHVRPLTWALLGIAAAGSLGFPLLGVYRQPRFLVLPLLALVPLAAVQLERAPLLARLGDLVCSALDLGVGVARVLALVAIAALLLQEGDYRRRRYERWEQRPVAGTKYGQAWRFLAAQRDRLGRPLRIAQSSTHNIPYPLYGSDLHNVARFVPASGRQEDLYYDWGTRQLHPFTATRRKAWRRFLQEFHPDFFFSSAYMREESFGTEERWASRERTLRLVYADSEVRIYARRDPRAARRVALAKTRRYLIERRSRLRY